MKLNRDKYAEATGTVRMLEKKILHKSSLERIIDSQTASEALKLLIQNTSVSFGESEVTAAAYEAALQTELDGMYSLLYDICEDKAIVDILKLKYIYLDKKTSEKKFAEQEGLKVNPQEIDLRLDAEYYAELLKMANDIDCEFISDYYKCEADFYNLKMILRAKAMKKPFAEIRPSLCKDGSIPTAKLFEWYDMSFEQIRDSVFYQYFGSALIHGFDAFLNSGSLGAFELACDNYLISRVKQSKMIAFGPEVLFCYALAKENELKQFRLIMSCKNNGISNELLRERLRDCYA